VCAGDADAWAASHSHGAATQGAACDEEAEEGAPGGARRRLTVLLMIASLVAIFGWPGPGLFDGSEGVGGMDSIFSPKGVGLDSLSGGLDWIRC